MKPSRALLHLALFFASVLPASADKLQDWYNLMPKGTAGIIAVKNTPEILADWDNSTFARFMADEAIMRWMAPMRAEGVTPWDKFFQDNYGSTMYDTLKDYPGALVSFLVVDDFKQFDKKDVPNVSLCELGDKQKEIEAHKAAEVEAAKKKKPDLKVSTTEINGVTVNVASEEEGEDATWFTSWAVVGDAMIETNSRKLMEYMIGALKSGAGDAPGVSRDHLARISEITQGTSDVMVYFNGVKLVELVEQSLAAAEAEKKDEEKEPSMGFDFKPQQVLDLLGARELQALAFTSTMDGDKFSSDLVLIHPEKPTGLVSLMRTSANEVALPGFIPADVLQGTVVRYDLVKLYDGLLNMVMKLGPMAMMVTMQIPGFEQQIGFKIRDDLFMSLEDEISTAQEGSLLDQSQVLAFKVRDADKLGGVLEGLKRFIGAGFGAFEESDYLGHQVNTLKLTQTANAASEVAYVFTGKYLLISVGKQDLLNKMLSRMKDPSGPSIWDSAQVQKLLAAAPKNFGSASVTDMGSLINMMASAASMFDSPAKMLKAKEGGKKKGPGKRAAQEDEEEEEEGEDPVTATAKKDELLDSKALPNKEVFERYFGRLLSVQYSLPDAIHAHYLIIAPEAQ